MIKSNVDQTKLQWMLKKECKMVNDEMKQKWNEKIKTVKTAWSKGLLELNDWETGFMDSVEQQMLHRGELTMQQSICLNKIYGKVK